MCRLPSSLGGGFCVRWIVDRDCFFALRACRGGKINAISSAGADLWLCAVPRSCRGRGHGPGPIESIRVATSIAYWTSRHRSPVMVPFVHDAPVNSKAVAHSIMMRHKLSHRTRHRGIACLSLYMHKNKSGPYCSRTYPSMPRRRMLPDHTLLARLSLSGVFSFMPMPL